MAVNTILSEARVGISQKVRRINSMKLNHTFFYSTCFRVFSRAENLKIIANVTNFAGCFAKKTEYSSEIVWIKVTTFFKRRVSVIL